MAEAATSRADRTAPPAERRGRVRGVLHCLWLSLVTSVAVEWIGMVWWWPEQGAAHAANVLAREAGHLSEDFRPAAGRILAATGRAYFYAFEWTGAAAGLRRLGGAARLDEYVKAALWTVQVLIVRVVLLAFSAPAFAGFAVVGLAGGLTLRDIRRWSAGREFGGVYHAAKRGAPKVLFAAAFGYLAIPFAVHPPAVVVPGAALFGVSALVVAASFKKYL
ncbi:MAG: DUF4400 domain-containing protein [Acidobacteria bacterium]|nr:DUF4400 domain-containing protein [Acidobacteriota bacterium]